MRSATSAGPGRAEDDRLLAALRLRDLGVPLHDVAVALGFATAMSLGDRLRDIDQDTTASERWPVPTVPDRAISTFCPEPGCWARLSRGNRSGVGRSHNHAAFICRSPACSR